MISNPILRTARISLALMTLSCGTAFAQPAPDTAERQDASASAKNSIRLIQVIAAMPAGTPWLVLKTATFCSAGTITKSWDGGRVSQALPLYAAAFKTELEHAGYKVITPGEDNLFDPDSASGDYEAAAVITDEHIDGCMNLVGGFLSGSNRGDIRGASSMKIDWQIYSPIKKQVVLHASTTGSAELDHSVPGGVPRLLSESFASNVRELASNADFRAALSASKPVAKGVLLPGQQSTISLVGSLKASKRPVGDAVASVVTVLTGSGSGSADLVSNDGYMVTNAHVVGDEKQVRVRWSDGIETVAEVVRVAKDRDVALIKTNPRDREPLPIKRGPVTPGARVYAIGSPLGKDYQGTVSSGIISATRVVEGLRYIQSDVSVTHGSSGGALLDENGAMIGITVSGVDRAPGLNFFIPIGDVMDFLALEQK
jgi:serine protease Do